MCDDFIDGGGWAIIGPLSEDIANEEQEIEKARRDTFGENYLEPEDPATDMDDENIDTDSDFDPETDW
jgi:hypothetical protein